MMIKTQHKKAERPHVLTLAGFDPSGGAGIQADIKTMEAHHVYGLSVCTAITVQNDVNFEQCYWTPVAQIEEQIQILFERFEIQTVKIGIVENLKTINHLIDFIIKINQNIKIVLDPIFTSSTKFHFHNTTLTSKIRLDYLDKILKKVFVLTPNILEILQMTESDQLQTNIDFVRQRTNLFLKGGHRTDKIGLDQLYTKVGQYYEFEPTTNNCYGKHGSGCVLSSSLASNIALNLSIKEACFQAKIYTTKFLCSNASLLGYHQL